METHELLEYNPAREQMELAEQLALQINITHPMEEKISFHEILDSLACAGIELSRNTTENIASLAFIRYSIMLDGKR